MPTASARPFPPARDASLRDEQLRAGRLPPPYRLLHVMERPKCFYLPEHSHAWYHINYVMTGSVRVTAGGEEALAVDGQAFILPPDVGHSLYSETGYAQLGMDIFVQEDQRGISQLVQDAFGRRFSVFTIERVRRDFDELYRAVKTPSRLGELRLCNTAEAVLLDIVETAFSASEMTFRFRFLELLDRLDPCAATLGQLCEEMRLSKTHLERLVQREFGCGAMRYCKKLKLAKVCRLLCSTDWTVKDIAEATHCYDESHLNTLFRQQFGMTPGRFRARARGQNPDALFSEKA